MIYCFKLRINNTTILTLLLITILSHSCHQDSSRDRITELDTMFTLLDPRHSGILFNNQLEEGPNTNIMMYEYFYNGGGVGVGDFNLDGLMDLYFTSNMGENKLYLNLGNWQFKEVTITSGSLGRSGPWKTGVAVVDINNDGLPDIHLSYSGAVPPEKRKNQFFINLGANQDGVPLFEDRAEQMGLASPAFTNQVYFLDYDGDGDLDLLQLNHNPKNIPILNEASTAQQLSIDSPDMGLRLFRQDNGFFTDVTVKSGINGSALSYGLSVSISDLNRDGLPDFYVANDYTIPDYLYINQGDGTFRNMLPEQMSHISQFSMGSDIADVNNDGWPDIFTLDMLPEDNLRQKLLMTADNYAKFVQNIKNGFHYQNMRNMLQLNNGNGTYSEIGQYAGISNTDWSWAALLVDLDYDGWRDLLVTNGYLRDYTNLDFINYMESVVASKGRLTRGDVLDMVRRMPASDVSNYLYQGSPDITFKNVTREWGLSGAFNSNGATYADLDNDGRLDLIISNINEVASIYKNNNLINNYIALKLKGSDVNRSAIGARIEINAGTLNLTYEHYLNRGYLSTVSDIAYIGLGKNSLIDSLKVIWPDGQISKLNNVAVNQTLAIDIGTANSNKFTKPPVINPLFVKDNKSLFNQNRTSLEIPNDFDRQTQLLNGLSLSHPAVAMGDVNGDGRQDLYIGGQAGVAGYLLIQNKDGIFQKLTEPLFTRHAASYDQSAVFVDVDNDGDLDLFVGSGGYHDFKPDDELLADRLYINDGKGKFTSFQIMVDAKMVSSSVAAADINGDGYKDLFIGGGVLPGSFPMHYTSRILINDGAGAFTDLTSSYCNICDKLGIVTDAHFVDLKADNSLQLITAGHWQPIRIFNVDDGQFANSTADYLPEVQTGLWNKILLHDFNKDGRPDILVGNLGLNNQFAYSDGLPIKMYADDFDGNGQIDPLIFYKIQEEYYPLATRDELLRQLPIFRSVYTDYRSYARAGMMEILNKLDISKADEFTVDELHTTLYLSNSQGAYGLGALPREVQYSSVHAMSVWEDETSGNDGIMIGGNDFSFKLGLGQIDANKGVLLKGIGNGKFEYVPQRESGFNIFGDVRHIITKGKMFYFFVSPDQMVIYEKK